jgi:hypothetical protein
MSAGRLLFLLLLFLARARGNKETTAHIFPCDGLWKDLADLSLSSPMLSEDRFPGNIVGPYVFVSLYFFRFTISSRSYVCLTSNYIWQYVLQTMKSSLVQVDIRIER